MAPRRVELESSEDGWMETTFLVPLPAGTTAIAISAPHDGMGGDAPSSRPEFLLGDGGSWPGLWPYSQSCGFRAPLLVVWLPHAGAVAPIKP
ncbi:MAG: hypothetical protein R3B70_10630 [Polyangiaceae bacterium]